MNFTFKKNSCFTVCGSLSFSYSAPEQESNLFLKECGEVLVLLVLSRYMYSSIYSQYKATMCCSDFHTKMV